MWVGFATASTQQVLQLKHVLYGSNVYNFVLGFVVKRRAGKHDIGKYILIISGIGYLHFDTRILELNSKVVTKM